MVPSRHVLLMLLVLFAGILGYKSQHGQLNLSIVMDTAFTGFTAHHCEVGGASCLLDRLQHGGLVSRDLISQRNMLAVNV